ncbi:aspartic peptidase domain-containing protein [Suillus spraguei]|nr:aspartic peptidase domain-containing protein [Suillus spraguei]
MTRRLTFSNVTDILRHDEARVAAFMEYNTHGRRANVPLSYDMNVGYTVSVEIGWPPTTYYLIVESSSSITWVGARNPYVSPSGVDTGDPVAFDYNFGLFQGTMFRDILTITDGLTIHGMLIGVTSTLHGVGFDGTLGIGPRVSSRDALQNENDPERTIPSVTDYLFEQDTIRQAVVGIFFKPIVGSFVNDGALSFGRADPTKYTGNIGYTDITTTPGSSLNWGINQRITYGDVPIMPRTAGFVDCGTTFLYIASDAYERYQVATDSTLNAANDLLQISTEQYISLQALKFYIGEQMYTLNHDAQIWPRSLNHVVFGVDHEDIFLVVKNLLVPSGTGCDFIMGYVFLQRFYTVFDADRSRVGFAETLHTYNVIN